eukprot:SAG31_NODE_6007_length_2217_cov_1.799339_1_plen_645_part_01
MRAKNRAIVTKQAADLEGAAQKVQAAFRGRQARVKGARRRVAVFGATGQIGTAVCRHALQQGFDVVGMSRRPDSDRAVALHQAGARIQFGDLDDAHSVDRFLAFVVHGDSFNKHTSAHTHVVEPAQIFAVFIIVPHAHYDGGGGSGAGWVREPAVELQRTQHAVDACKRARVNHVFLLSGCTGLESHGAGPRSELFRAARAPRTFANCWKRAAGSEAAGRRCPVRPPCALPVPSSLPPFLAAKPAAEQYLIASLGGPADGEVGLLQPRGTTSALDKLVEKVRTRLRQLASDDRKSTELSRSFAGLKRVFSEFDENGDGTLSRDEFRSSLRKLKLGILTKDIDQLYDAADINADGSLDYTEFIERVLRIEKTVVERSRENGGAWEVGWTILRPVLLMDNFWSWQTPWLHPRRSLRMVHHKDVKLQLVWADDVGNVAGRILAELDPGQEGGRDYAAIGRRRWHGRALDLAADEVTPEEAAFVFNKLRGRRGRTLKYRQYLPPSDTCCGDCLPPSFALLCGSIACLRLQERLCWGYDHATASDAEWHAAGGGGSDMGRLRLEYPWLASLELATQRSGWHEQPSPEWTSPLLCGWLSAPHWMLATILSPCGVAAWTASKLWPAPEQPEIHGILYGCAAPCFPCAGLLLQ